MVHHHLDKLEASRPIPEDKLLSELRLLFEPTVYTDIHEELPEEFLFMLCRTQILLAYYRPSVSSPSVSQGLKEAEMKVTKLQAHVGTLYGPAFSAQRACKDHSVNLDKFLKAMPPRMKKRTDETFVKEAQNILTDLNKHLVKAGLRN